MKGYRFITDDDTSEFCHRVTEALHAFEWLETKKKYSRRAKNDV